MIWKVKSWGMKITFLILDATLLSLKTKLMVTPKIELKIIKEIKTIMKEQQINHKIPYYIPEDVTILHKTGEADGITHDIGIVYSKNPFIIGFASNETNIQEFEDIIRKISRFIYEESEK